MIADVLQGIVDAIHGLYEDIEIHTGQLKQGFNTPCFFIKLITSNTTHELGNRYHDDMTFQISYFPGGGPDYKDMYRKLQPLMMALQRIRPRDAADQKKRYNEIYGRDWENTVDDDVLHIIGTYTIFYYLPLEKVPAMETLTQTQRTTKEDL